MSGGKLLRLMGALKRSLDAAKPRVYTYRGDRGTDPALKGKRCSAVLRPDGKCIRGGSKMLVLFDGEEYPRAVIAAQLRKVNA